MRDISSEWGVSTVFSFICCERNWQATWLKHRKPNVVMWCFNISYIKHPVEFIHSFIQSITLFKDLNWSLKVNTWVVILHYYTYLFINFVHVYFTEIKYMHQEKKQLFIPCIFNLEILVTNHKDLYFSHPYNKTVNYMNISSHPSQTNSIQSFYLRRIVLVHHHPTYSHATQCSLQCSYLCVFKDG